MDSQPVKFSSDYPERLSRAMLLLKTFFDWFYVLIPHEIALFFYSIAALVVAFIAWWAILFTGKYPKGLFDFVVGYQRWSNRVNTCMLLMSDVYPPFRAREQRLRGIENCIPGGLADS
jgi:hypothetical protein